VGSDRVGTSRAGRAARITGAAAAVAARSATARVLSAGSGSSDGDSPASARQAAALRQQLRAAESLVKVFSGMRGAAMKAGQTLSAVDLGLVPEEVRPQFQEILASLQQNAEPVSFRAIRKVIEEDLDERLSSVFSEFDEQPIAAASIGQVHRATLRDGGRDVAVKVQYPGIAEAIHADLQNLRLGLKLLAVIAPGIDTGEIATEIRERITDELDYELEASNHREMARAYRGHPFMFVPDVVTSVCRERVLVSEFVDGERFAAATSYSQADRDRIGEILVRFYINGPLRHRLLNGDPHPGNNLFLPDGRVAFIDFGFFKHLTDADVRQLVISTRATYEGDADALLGVITELGSLPPDPSLAGPFLESYDAIFGWLMVHEPLTADPTKTATMMRHYNQLRSAEGFERLKLPAEHFVLMRSVFLLIGLLGQLRSTNAWFDIAGEWLLGSEPSTELGRAEQEFFAGHYDYDTEVAV
jgi:predicted unusual protein kinase regulating ubiquinone biosynthesis (AarF/ABC1/UbiB family)